MTSSSPTTWTVTVEGSSPAPASPSLAFDGRVAALSRTLATAYRGVASATERGWICLYCGYTQDSASSSMKNWRWKEIHWRELEGMRREG